MSSSPIADSGTEEFLPILAAGRHRTAKRGACFMEFASYLAGERWSDHPRAPIRVSRPSRVS